jgi:hypothetical protein
MASSLQIGLHKKVPLKPPATGSSVVGGSQTRPLWFDGRFLASHDLEREQIYFLRRQAEMGRAGGFGVVHGLMVYQSAASGQSPNPETIVIEAGNGIAPSGALVMISTDLTIQLSDLPDEEALNEQFGLSATPQQPARTRTGLYVVALRPVQFTANPIGNYPASIQSPRVAHDGDVVEATAVSLVPYPNPVNNYDASVQQAAVARQIFVLGDTGTLSDAVLPLAMVSIDRDEIQWIDPYLVRRNNGPLHSDVLLGLSDPTVQQAFLMQYDAQLQSVVAARKNGNFSATDYFQALPPAGRFPLEAIDTGKLSQIFFPQQMNVQLSVIPVDELPALIEESMSLPPIDLTLAADAYANLSAFVLFPVPRNNFAGLAASLPQVSLNPTLPQVPLNRRPLQLAQLFQSRLKLAPAPPVSSGAWGTALQGQAYGFYVLRRSEPVFVDFATPAPVTTTTPAPTTTPPPTTTAKL